MLSQKFNQTLDAQLQLADGATVTASGAATVGGAAKILDLSASVGPTAGMGLAPLSSGVVLLDISAIVGADITGRILAEVSNSSSFASGIHTAGVFDISLAANQLHANNIQPIAGRYFMPILNWRNLVYYRYLRLYNVLAGTTPSTIYHAWFLPGTFS